MPHHQSFGGGDNCGIVAEAGEPVHKGLLAEPSDLALGVSASGLGDRFGGGGESDRSFEVGVQFAIADKVEGLGILRNAVANEACNFIEPAALQHSARSPLDAV